MQRKFIFFSLCLFLVVFVVPSFSQDSDNADKYKKPTIDVIADEDLTEHAAVPQARIIPNKGKPKGPTNRNQATEQPKPEVSVDTPAPEVNAANNINEPVTEPVVETKEASKSSEKTPSSKKTEDPTPSTEEKTPEQPAEIIPQDTQPAHETSTPDVKDVKSNNKPNNNNKPNKGSSAGSRNPHDRKPIDEQAVVPEVVATPEPEPVVSEPVIESQPEPVVPEPVIESQPEPVPEPEPVVPEPVIESEPEPVPEPTVVAHEEQFYQDQYVDPSAIPQVNYDIPLDQLDQFADRYEPVYQHDQDLHVEPEPEVQYEPEPEAQSEPEPEAQSEPEPEAVAEIKPEPVQQQQQHHNIPSGNNNNRGRPIHAGHEAEVAPKPVVKQNPEVQQQQQGHRNIEVQRQTPEANRQNSEANNRQQKQQERFEADQQFDESDYFRLIGDHSNDYLNQYKVYSEHFFNYVEGLFDEAVVPLYRQVRQHEYLSMGLSALIGFYLLITFTKLFLSLFRKKPKFRYNKEETISQSDINANFKKFLGELESLKKQISTGVTSTTKGGSSSENAVAIPASLQQDLSTIINTLARNDDAINRVIREKGKSDTFLMDFQKEVVESHKAIWNELYQLRKIFSHGKVNTLSSTGKARTDIDDSKSLSSNPEGTESRRSREDHRTTPSKVGEPRSKSVTPSDPIRSRPVAPKEKKPVEVETEKAAPFVNGHAQEEKPQSATNVDKLSAPQITFNRSSTKEEETQPGIQIPTNLNENDPTHNPFATAHPTHPTSTTPTINSKPGIPFGNPALRGKPNVGKPPGIPSSQNANLVSTSMDSNPNLLAKPELSASRKSSMDVKGTTPAPVLNMPATLQPTFEQPVERLEEKIPAPEQEGITEDNQTTEEGEPENKGGFIPPMKPGGMTPAFPRGKPMVPGNKAIPQARRTGPPGTTVFKGPPGNLPRPGIPTQIKPSTPIPEGVPKTNNSQV